MGFFTFFVLLPLIQHSGKKETQEDTNNTKTT